MWRRRSRQVHVRVCTGPRPQSAAAYACRGRGRRGGGECQGAQHGCHSADGLFRRMGKSGQFEVRHCCAAIAVAPAITSTACLRVSHRRARVRAPVMRSTASRVVAISPRVATALRRRARSASRTRRDPNNSFAGLVFCRPDGRPLGPHLVLDRLHRLSEEADVPRVTVHDLRHLAATITAGVPLTVVSKNSAEFHAVDHSQPLQPPHPTSRAPRRRHHRQRSQRSRADGRPYGPARVAATTARPHPQTPRSPSQAPLPRTQCCSRAAPARACDHTATTTLPDARKVVLS